jgi:hypothetical protein
MTDKLHELIHLIADQVRSHDEKSKRIFELIDEMVEEEERREAHEKTVANLLNEPDPDTYGRTAKRTL